jgi:hypothetical protein
MPDAKVGMAVMVDLSGFTIAAALMRADASVGGEVTAIDLVSHQVTVKLNVTISGVDTVTVNPDRVTAITD